MFSSWGTKVPPKVKHFVRGAAHSSLPTAGTLARIRLNVDPHCYICGHESETICPALFQCRVAYAVWESCVLVF